jgi:trimeric autotransporter adhesin
MGHEFAQALVASEIANGSFTIKTDKPNIKVSWQVTGVRQDAWANAHRIPVEEDKPEADKGKYLHPELFGRANEASIEESHRPSLPKLKKIAPVDAAIR